MLEFARNYIEKNRGKRFYTFLVYGQDNSLVPYDYGSYQKDYLEIFNSLYSDSKTRKIEIRPYRKNGTSKVADTPMTVEKEQTPSNAQPVQQQLHLDHANGFAGASPQPAYQPLGQVGYEQMYLSGIQGEKNRLQNQLDQANAELKKIQGELQETKLKLISAELEVKHLNDSKPTGLGAIVQELPVKELIQAAPAILGMINQQGLQSPQMGGVEAPPAVSEIATQLAGYVNSQSTEVQGQIMQLMIEADQVAGNNPAIYTQLIEYIQQNKIQVAK